MKTFDEVLKKHFTDFYDGQEVRNTTIGTYTYSDTGDTTIDRVIIYIAIPDGWEWIPLQSFQSPEKLDKFLTLLFEEN